MCCVCAELFDRLAKYALCYVAIIINQFATNATHIPAYLLPELTFRKKENCFKLVMVYWIDHDGRDETTSPP